MKHFDSICCPDCDGDDICKNGKSENGTQRWLCLNKDCPRRSFQRSYSYKAHEKGVKEKIDDLAVNSSGVRDTARVLGIGKGTVIRHLKKKNLPR